MQDTANIRLCRDSDVSTVLGIINGAAQRYRGVIPDDCWRQPYMPATELARDVAEGMALWVYEADGAVRGLMGLQRLADVALIRHAYVEPTMQQTGIGGLLLRHLDQLTPQPVLVGTWAAARWAIRFYERHGFELVQPEPAAAFLEQYWNVPARQMAASVVLKKGDIQAALTFLADEAD